MNNKPTTTLEALRLSAIYRQCLEGIISIAGGWVEAPGEDGQQRAIELISDAVGQALQLLSARCSNCDTPCMPLCPACIVAVQQAATKLSVEEEEHQESW